MTAVRQTPPPSVARSIINGRNPKDQPPSYLAVPHDMQMDLYALLPEEQQHKTGVIRLSPYQPDDYFLQPKYRGAVPMMFDQVSGTFWTRALTPVNFLLNAEEVKDKLAKYRSLDNFRWLHVLRLNNVDPNNGSKFCCIVVDIVDPDMTYAERREVLEKMGPPQLGIKEIPSVDGVYLVPHFSEAVTEELWCALHLQNQMWPQPWYDGIIAKKADSLYPVQMEDSKKETVVWQKHYFASQT